MKGYLVELRNVANPNFVTGSGSLFETATPEQRYRMARTLLGKTRVQGDYMAIEYRADWSDCTNPEFIEIKRYIMDGSDTVPEGIVAVETTTTLQPPTVPVMEPEPIEPVQPIQSNPVSTATADTRLPPPPPDPVFDMND